MKRKHLSAKSQHAIIVFALCLFSYLAGVASVIRPVEASVGLHNAPSASKRLPLAQSHIVAIEVKGDETYKMAEDRVKNNPAAVEKRIRELAAAENYPWPDHLVKLFSCESSLNPSTINKNRDGSLDRGVAQWNDKWHPEISDACAFDVDCATKAAMKRITDGYQREWMCNDIVLGKK